MREITPEQVDWIGKLVDKCDNLIAAATLPMSDHIHVEGLREGVKDLKVELEQLYGELGGE